MRVPIVASGGLGVGKFALPVIAVLTVSILSAICSRERPPARLQLSHPIPCGLRRGRVVVQRATIEEQTGSIIKRHARVWVYVLGRFMLGQTERGKPFSSKKPVFSPDFTAAKAHLHLQKLHFHAQNRDFRLQNRLLKLQNWLLHLQIPLFRLQNSKLQPQNPILQTLFPKLHVQNLPLPAAKTLKMATSAEY